MFSVLRLLIRNWKKTKLADSEAIPIQLGVHELAGNRNRSQAEFEPWNSTDSDWNSSSDPTTKNIFLQFCILGLFGLENLAMEDEGCSISKPVAVTACTAMAFFYVAVLYAPTLILRLPPPPSLQVFMIRRFLCAFVSTAVSILVCALILPVSFNYFSAVFNCWNHDYIVCICYDSAQRSSQHGTVFLFTNWTV